MTVFAIIPTRRHAHLRVLSQLRAFGQDVVPIWAENGPAAGRAERWGLPGIKIRCDVEDPFVARNLALEYAKRRGGLAVMIDDDDLYLPGHLRASLELMRPGAVVGIADHYVRTRADRLWLIKGPPGPPQYLVGQTMLFYARDAVYWDAPRASERPEASWFTRMRARGLQLIDRGPAHWCRVLHATNLWAPPDDEWPLRCHECWDLGPFDHRAIERPPAGGRRVMPTASAAAAAFARIKEIQCQT